MTRDEVQQIANALDSTLEDEGVNEKLIKNAMNTLEHWGEVLFNLADFLESGGDTVIVYRDSNTEKWFALQDGETYRLENLE